MLKNLYSKVGVWKNRSELTSYLANSCVLYRDHGLLVINKPFNLGISPSTQNEFSLPEIIPELKDILQLPYLDYISSPERFSTGLLILGTTPESKNLMDFPALITNLKTIDSYKYAYSGTKSVEPVLTRNLYSKTKLKSSKSLLRYYLFTETLVKSSLGQSALVCVSPSSIENHFIQLYMSDLLSPVLGDFLYSYRVNSINGYPTKVSHTSSPPNKVQKLSPWILNALGFNPGEEYILPKHIHKYRIILKQFISGKDDLVLVAPPPDYFMETCNALKVSFDNIKLPIREHYIEPKSKEIEPAISITMSQSLLGFDYWDIKDGMETINWGKRGNTLLLTIGMSLFNVIQTGDCIEIPRKTISDWCILVVHINGNYPLAFASSNGKSKVAQLDFFIDVVKDSKFSINNDFDMEIKSRPIDDILIVLGNELIQSSRIYTVIMYNCEDFVKYVRKGCKASEQIHPVISTATTVGNL
ncbi:unnamed protein product [Lepeophtheirus salmonis]|uniref:(salmon louse) hypothetical protein n=1 Tax=Lepeophtheirus salmonis TaxID=72036 RepID=A0A7R8H3V0_LEPSM|nr:unnamed protein product [Lepeophtheirus salmonis]CAF2839804.1 unnamed protein product [Lepeophtheirus salmonis]